LDKVTVFVESLPEGVGVVSGGARGVDTLAIALAKERALATQELEANWDRWAVAAGMFRNADIIAKADWVVAFWDGLAKVSKGTLNTIRRARKAGLHVDVVRPDSELPPIPEFMLGDTNE